MTNQSVTLSFQQAPESDELKELREKKELNESEWLRMKELTQKRIQSIKTPSLNSKEVFDKIRHSTLLWVIMLWITYAFLPKNYIEYSLSAIFPVLFFVTGLIHSVELLFIVLILMLAAMLKMGLFSGKIRSMTDPAD